MSDTDRVFQGLDFGHENPTVISILGNQVSFREHMECLRIQMENHFCIPIPLIEFNQRRKRQVKTMSVVHVDKTGSPKFIAAMEDGDVLEVIKEFSTPLVTINGRIDVDEVPRSKLSKLSYGEPDKINPDKYQQLMRMTQLKIAPYVIEAALRNLEELPPLLQNIFGGRKERDAAAPKPNNDSMNQGQVDLVRTIARRKSEDSNQVLALDVWAGQDDIDVPAMEDVIIDA